MEQPTAQCVHEDGFTHDSPYEVIKTNGGDYKMYYTCNEQFSMLMFMAEVAAMKPATAKAFNEALKNGTAANCRYGLVALVPGSGKVYPTDKLFIHIYLQPVAL